MTSDHGFLMSLFCSSDILYLINIYVVFWLVIFPTTVFLYFLLDSYIQYNTLNGAALDNIYLTLELQHTDVVTSTSEGTASNSVVSSVRRY
jgi:hypothetical protein